MNNLLRTLAGFLAVSVLAVAFSFYSSRAARSSDHQDSPTVVNNPMEDITDMYVFPDSQTPGNVVFAVNFCPLIGAGCPSNPTFDPNVLYQIKIATGYGSATPDYKEHIVIQMKANTAGTNPTFTIYGPGAPNEVATSNTLVATAGQTPYNQTTTLGNGIKVFVGPRHDPFFIDLGALFKILPDRNYKDPQKDTSPMTNPKFTSFNFPSGAAPVKDVTGTPYTANNMPGGPPATASSLGCNIQMPTNTVAPFDVESFVISVPKTMLVPAGQALGPVGIWATTSTPTGS
ncbi:MAG: hypothetical protein DLM53_01145 [Candidatus Eremiobacter antarcticus]|nr:MAG: hypothetical protein DLM50_07140 [Candidatus Eremiobacteraeota bacterium]PZR64352.1 MAG: hypothetical protein DLM53_01145 [Candidatus Eremiobacter sp. RRmetagenome_bin22]